MGFPRLHPVTGQVQWSYDASYLADGHEHSRNSWGFCIACGSTAGEPHYRLKPKE